jgi:hypothetical protein
MPSGGSRLAKRPRPWHHRHRNCFRAIDGRLAEGKLERRVIRDLVEHVGGSPTAPQRILIELSAKLTVALAVMSDKLVTKGCIDEAESKYYLAWVGHLRRNLETLGLKQPQAQPKRLADVIKLKGDAA